MTLPLPAPSIDSKDFGDAMSGIQQNFDLIARQFPVLSTQVGGQICGTVNSAGAIVRGGGFTVNKTGTGLYTVTLNNTLANPPVVIVSCDTTGGAITIKTTNITTSGFVANASADTGFSFVVLSV